MSPVHQVWPKASCKAQWRKKARQIGEEVGRQHQGLVKPGVRQVTEGSGEQGKNGENWLRNHLWCPNNRRGWGIDDDDDDVAITLFSFSPVSLGAKMSDI